MARPRHENPTPAELEILKILWERGPSTVRQVLDELQKQRRKRAYTTVMSILNIMTEKKLVGRKQKGRAFIYTARLPREKTLGRMVGDLWNRAFEGSTSTLVAHLLEQAHPDEDELRAIRRLLEDYQSEGDPT